MGSEPVAHTQNSSRISENEVWAEESSKLKERRRKAIGAEFEESPPVGLALSGGGIRSAAFNLGILQTLSHRGVLPYVDYLACVSGGGFVGGHLAAVSACENAGENFHASPEAKLGVSEEGRIYSHDNGDSHRDGGKCYRFFSAPNYLLLNIPRFLWLYARDTLITGAFVIGALGMLATVTAVFWRLFDLEEARAWSGILGFQDIADELFSAFIPLLLLIVAWPTGYLFVQYLRARQWKLWQKAIVTTIVAAAVICFAYIAFFPTLIVIVGWPTGRFVVKTIRGLKYSGRTKIAAGAVAAIVALTLMVGAAFFPVLTEIIALILCLFLTAVLVHGLYEAVRLWRGRKPAFERSLRYLCICALVFAAVSLAVFLANAETGTSMGQATWFTWQNTATTIGLIAGITQMLSLFTAKSIFRSFEDRSPGWMKIVGRTIMYGPAIFIPLLLVHVMAKDNISGFASTRGPNLLRRDIEAWPGFLSLFANDGELAKSLSKATGNSSEITDDITSLNNGIKHLGMDEREIRGDDHFARRESRPLLTLLGSGTAAYDVCRFESCRLVGLVRWLDRERERQGWSEYEYPPDCPLWRCRLWRYFRRREQIKRAQQTLIDELNENWLRSGMTTNRLLHLVEKRAKTADKSQSKDDHEKIRGFVKAREEEMRARSGLVKRWSIAYAAWDSKSGLDVIPFGSWDEEVVADTNRVMLEALYPGIVRERVMASTAIVAARDQWTRACWLMLFVVMFVSTAYFDVNYHSPLFRYYRESIANAFLGEPGYESAPLAELRTWERGGPYPLFCASQILLKADDGNRFRDFLLSPLYCGSNSLGYASTSESTTVADALAVSGSALSPLAIPAPLSWPLPLGLNIRLGRIVSVSGKEKQEPCRAWWVLLTWLRRTFTPASYSDESHCPDRAFVADGGFRDFLGFEELLRRRCGLIILSDAGARQGNRDFGVMAQALEIARQQCNVEFLDLDHDRPVDVGRFRCDEESKTIAQPFSCFRVRYPEKRDATGNIIASRQEALVVYLRMGLSGLEDVVIQHVKTLYPSFPDEPTINQFFSQRQFDAYRSLGFHIAQLACSEMPPHALERFRIARQTLQALPASAGNEYDLLRQRFLDAYVIACHREGSYSVDDVDAGYLWFFEKLPGLRQQDIGSFSTTPWSDDFFEPAQVSAWIDLYSRDADLRRLVRHELMALARTGFSGSAIPGTLLVVPGKMSVTAVACYELATAERLTTFDKFFQVGGRRQLIRTCVKLARRMRGGPATTVDPDRIPEFVSEPLFHLCNRVFRRSSTRPVAFLAYCLMRQMFDVTMIDGGEKACLLKRHNFVQHLAERLEKRDEEGVRRILQQWNEYGTFSFDSLDHIQGQPFLI